MFTKRLITGNATHARTANGNEDGNALAAASSTETAAPSTAAAALVLSAEDVIKQKQVQFQIPAGNGKCSRYPPSTKKYKHEYAQNFAHIHVHVHTDTTECKKNGFVYQNGDFVPSPDPCEACYCLRETVRCVTQRCELPEDTRQGCMPVYMDGICCPVRYQCGGERAFVVLVNFKKKNPFRII